MNNYKETSSLTEYLDELENHEEIYDDFELKPIEAIELSIHQIFNQAVNALNQIL